MKKYVIIFFLMNIIFSCNKSKKKDITLNVKNITLNGKNSDFIENTLIILEFVLINNSSNEIIFRASASDNIYRKSRLILMDTISRQYIDIFTGDLFILKQKNIDSIYGSINLLSEKNNQYFFYGNDYDDRLIKDKSYVLKKINHKLKSCKIYYIQNEEDLVYVDKTGYDNIAPIKDTLETKCKLFVR